MRAINRRNSVLGVLLAVTIAYGQDSRGALEQRLTAQYPLTHPSGDEKDILSPGIVLVLKKDKLLMVPISDPELQPNVYKDGKIGENRFAGTIHRLPGVRKRIFMATEKMWVTQIEVKDDGVVFDLLSDPIDDVRYKGAIRFPFAKGTVPLYDDIGKSVAEVFNTEALPSAAAVMKPEKPEKLPIPEKPEKQAASKLQAEAPPPIAPPPPPVEETAAATNTVSIGQTPDQVVAIMGKPQTILKASNTKQIYMYPKVKITFVSNKVSDIQ